MKPLTEYTDYRIYLADVVVERKSHDLPASNRWFAAQMNINSTSWLTMVLKGKIGLSKTTANKLSVILHHSILHTRYFEALVFFNQSRSIEHRNRYFNDMAFIRKQKEVLIVSELQYDYYSVWYHSAVRSLIGMYSFSGDYQQLAEMVSPQITLSQARKSVELLERIGLIRKNPDGVYELTSPAIHTGPQVQSLAVANFQIETMRLAQEAMDRYSPQERHIQTMTVGVSASTFQKIKQLLNETNQKIAELANDDNDADRVYHVNFHAFPLSKIHGHKDVMK